MALRRRKKSCMMGKDTQNRLKPEYVKQLLADFFHIRLQASKVTLGLHLIDPKSPKGLTTKAQYK